MSYTPNTPNQEASSDAGGRTRTSEMTTLFDGKTLNIDDEFTYKTTGTGTKTFQANKALMSVTSGQYLIRQNTRTIPYFSGKSQLIEMTFDTFGTQAGITKRAGYFNSNAVAPYDTNKDGFWIENDGTTIRLKVENNGTSILNLPFAEWDGYSKLSDYDWNNFTVVLFDFLWLGGAVLRVFIKTDKGFILAHTYTHASNAQGVMIATPNHNVRYEIRSLTTVGAMRAICSQAATEGSSTESGYSISHVNLTAVATNVVGTQYAILGVKKSTSFRDITATITSIGSSNTSTTDAGILMIVLNPTLSAPLTYTAKSKVLFGIPATSITLTPNTGRIIHALPSGTIGAGYGLNDSYLSCIGMDIDDVSDEFVVVYMPTTANQSIYCSLTVKEN
jgi:hypothetical protein